MIIFAALILLVGSAASDPLNLGSQGIDYRLLPKNYFSTFDVADCVNNTIVCDGCHKVAICKWKEVENEWGLDPLMDCPSGQTCHNGICLPKDNPKCSPYENLNFICTMTGMFPDPGDCKKYHFCVKDGNDLKNYDAKCTDGYGYNPKSTFCDKILTNGECAAYPVPLCKTLGERGVVKENPTIYYMCVRHPDTPAGDDKTLYPMLLACQHGKIYNPTTGECK